jgi:ribosomal protein S18 acetylase RimI-like enzyme
LPISWHVAFQLVRHTVEVDRTADIPTYGKVPFEWGPSQVLSDHDDPDGVSWLDADHDERFLEVVAGVLAASPDASDVAAVAAVGATNAARRLLDAPPAWGVSHESGWWTVLSFGAEPAAFVLPVTYDNCERDGLDEATIFHMGVLPEHRGRGLGRTLLRRATRTLVTHGVWRIICDTSANNEPMIHLFESEGWHRLPPHERPVLKSG